MKQWLLALGIVCCVVGYGGPCPLRAEAEERDRQTSVPDEATVTRNDKGEVIAIDLRGLFVSAETLRALEKYPKLSRVVFADTGVTDAELTALGRLSSLENIDLRGCGISDNGIRQLEQLPALKVLRLSGKNGKTRISDRAMDSIAEHQSLKACLLDFTAVGDEGVARLKGHPEIREIGLAGTRISDEAVVMLATLPRLSALRVAGSEVEGKGLTAVSHHPRLKSLDISGCKNLREDAIGALVAIPQLVKLNLYDTPISDTAAVHLAGMKKLKWLNLDKTLITDRSLQNIAGLQNLEFLHLGSTNISDAAIPELSKLAKLKTLIITRTHVTAAGVESLASHLPETEIRWDGEVVDER